VHGLDTSRRTFLRGTAAAAAVAAVPTVAQADEHWEVVETPTGNTLYDVEYTAEGAYAVGAGGTTVER